MHAVPQPHRRLLLLLLGSCIALLLASPTLAAAAPVVSKDGRVNACYRVKGKTKGTVRVIPAKQRKCRKGERRLAWSVTGPAGPAGAPASSGTAGGNGATGATGSAGTSGSEADLEAKIASLTIKVEGLEDLLQGVTSGDLSGVLGKLGGITGTELGDAVDAVPLVGELCDQTATLIQQTNLLRGVFDGLGLSPALAAIGLLQVPALPPALSGIVCPS